MASEAQHVGEVITRTGQVARDTAGRQALFRLGAWAAAGLMAAVAADAVLQLPDGVRALISAAGLAAAVLAGVAIRRGRAGAPRPETLARLVEEKDPSLDNALINAVQFEGLLPQTPRPLTRGLMAAEVRRAEQRAAGLDPGAIVDRAQMLRARRLLQGVAVVLAASILLLPRLYLAVLPRYLDPFGDHPPFCFTRFAVEVGQERVRFGDAVPITVRVSGELPRSLSLVTSTDGRKWSSAPLFQVTRTEYNQRLEDIRADTVLYVRSESGRSKRQRVRVIATPQVKGLDVTYRFPEYTHLPPATQKVGEKGIEGVSGTEATLRVTSNRPLKEGRLRLALQGERDPRVLPLVPDPSNNSTATARFQIRRPGEFTLDLAGADGLASPGAASGKVTLLKDERPLIYITEPEQQAAFATPDVKVPVTLQAEDTFGLRSLELHRSLNDSADFPLTLPLPSPGPRETEQRLELDMADLGVRPGDAITLYGRAYDTDPQRANSADTEPVTIQIISKEQYKKLLQSQQSTKDLAERYQAPAQEMEKLAEQQRALGEQTQALQEQLAKGATPDAPKQAKELAAKQKELAKQAQDLAQQMADVAKQKPLLDIEKDLNRKMMEMAVRMAQAAGSMNSAGQSLAKAGAGKQSAAQAARARKSQQAAMQRMGQAGQSAAAMKKALEELQRVYPLYEDLAKFMALVEAQSTLELKAREFERLPRPNEEQRKRMEDLGRWQTSIRQALGEVLSDIEQHAGDVEKQHPGLTAQARGFCKQARGLPIDKHMASTEDALGRHDGRPGHDEAQAALDLMKKLLQPGGNCQGQAKGGMKEFCFRLGINPGDTCDQLAGGLGMGMGMGMGSGFMPGPGMSGAFGQAMMGPGATGGNSFSIYGPQTPKAGGPPTMGHRQKRQKPPGAEVEAILSPGQVEVLQGGGASQPDMPDARQDAYPAEYRVLVREYLRRVAEDSAKGR